MTIEPKISLDCPYCKEPIYAAISWFKQDYFSCPACDLGLAAGQYASVIKSLEQEMAANIEEMLNGSSSSSCCGKKSSCCH